MPAVALVGFTSVMAQILVPFAATLADPAHRGRVVGTIMSGLLLGILLARTASGLIAQYAGWRGVYIIFAVLMVAQTITMWTVLPTYRADVKLGYGRLLGSVFVIARQEPVLRLRALFGVVSFASFSVLWTTLAFLLSGPPYDYSEGIIGLFGLVGAAGALTASVVGRFTDRGWARPLTGISALLLLLGFVLLWRGGVSLPALLAGIVVLDVGSNGVHLSNQSEIYRLRPEARSRINAFYMTSCFIGAAAGSAVAAFVYERWSWDGVCVLGAAIALCGLALWAFGPRHSARAQEAAEARSRAEPAAERRRPRIEAARAARENPCRPHAPAPPASSTRTAKETRAMRFIDAHLHTDMIEDVQLQKLVMMGMEAAVIPSPHMFVGTHDADTVLLLWERFLTMEATTAKTLGYEAFTSISVPFFGVNRADAEQCLERMPEFLANERVVAMGEIGLDCGTEFEEWLFREHLRLAKAHDLPVILHTPIRLAPQGPVVTPRVYEIIKEEGYPVERCVFDHAGEETMDFRMSTGGMVGLSASAGTRCRRRPRPASSSTTPSGATASSSTPSSAAWATTTSWCRACSSP